MSEMVKYKGNALLKRQKSGPVFHHLWHSPCTITINWVFLLTPFREILNKLISMFLFSTTYLLWQQGFLLKQLTFHSLTKLGDQRTAFIIYFLLGDCLYSTLQWNLYTYIIVIQLKLFNCSKMQIKPAT